MKICVVGDVHWSTYSSILRQRGERYSVRLENCIKSVNWAEETAFNLCCDKIIYLGDFFDSTNINAEELSALTELKLSQIPHVFLCGNHEIATQDMSHISIDYFNRGTNCTVIRSVVSETVQDCELVYLPYIFNAGKRTLGEFVLSDKHTDFKIIFSHNDIAGVQMGTFKSVNGFDIDEIENSCDLFVNGHLHNGTQITEKICNLGNLTGQNFSENAFMYQHKIAIIDTKEKSVDFIANPYALYFAQLDFSEFTKEQVKEAFSQIGITNGVLSIKCNEDNYSTIQSYVDKSADNYEPHEDIDICASRLIVQYNHTENTNTSAEVLIHDNDYLKKFVSFVHENIETDDLTDEILGEMSHEH